MNRLIGSIALVSGTAIGAGMLSLPVVTASMGFIPSLILFVAMCCLMIYVGLLIVEVLSILPANATMISMAADTMGPWGRKAATISYFFLLLMLNIAYLSGATQQIIKALGFEYTLFYRLIIGAILSIGLGWLSAAHTGYVDRVNRWLFGGLVGCFVAMLLTVIPSVKLEYLAHSNWTMALTPLALILTSFGYHPIIPNIFDYLDRDIKQTRLAIILGTLIPFVVYLSWQIMVLGTVPIEGNYGLNWAFQNGLPSTHSLESVMQVSYLNVLIASFAFLAILTSFLGTMLALAEFVADACGWSINETTKPRLAVAVAAPLLLFTLVGTRLFLNALGFAGIWAAILLGCLPVAMAALARKRHAGQFRPYLVFGGYPLMGLSFLCFVLVILVELYSHL